MVTTFILMPPVLAVLIVVSPTLPISHRIFPRPNIHYRGRKACTLQGLNSVLPRASTCVYPLAYRAKANEGRVRSMTSNPSQPPSLKRALRVRPMVALERVPRVGVPPQSRVICAALLTGVCTRETPGPSRHSLTYPCDMRTAQRLLRWSIEVYCRTIPVRNAWHKTPITPSERATNPSGIFASSNGVLMEEEVPLEHLDTFWDAILETRKARTKSSDHLAIRSIHGGTKVGQVRLEYSRAKLSTYRQRQFAHERFPVASTHRTTLTCHAHVVY